MNNKRISLSKMEDNNWLVFVLNEVHSD